MSNPIISTLVIITLCGFVASFLFYRLSFSNRTMFKGRMRLLQFLLGIVLPPLVLLPVFQLYRLMEREVYFPIIPLSDDSFLFVLFLSIVWASVGNGMHVAGVSIDYKVQNLDLDGYDEEEKALIYVIDFFHHSFSHLLVHVPVLASTFILLLFELNHHDQIFMDLAQVTIIIILGVVLGTLYGLSVIEGSNWKSVMPIQSIFIVLGLYLIAVLKVPIFILPVSLCFLLAYISGFVLLALWGIYHHGFPEIMGELVVKDGHPRSPRAKEAAKKEPESFG